MRDVLSDRPETRGPLMDSCPPPCPPPLSGLCRAPHHRERPSAGHTSFAPHFVSLAPPPPYLTTAALRPLSSGTGRLRGWRNVLMESCLTLLPPPPRILAAICRMALEVRVHDNLPVTALSTALMGLDRRRF